MLVDVTQLHKNHLHNIHLQLLNVESIVTDMLTYHPSMVQASLSAMADHLHDIYHKIEQTIAAAQLHRLTPLLWDHVVLFSINNWGQTQLHFVH